MFRVAGTQVSPVTMSCPSPRTAVPLRLPLGIKDSLKEDMKLFDKERFLTEGELLKGGLLKGKELLKENC
jgi:hypothetical protein